MSVMLEYLIVEEKRARGRDHDYSQRLLVGQSCYPFEG